MAHTHGGEEEPVAYRGEVWTDGRGRAVIVLPPDAPALARPLAYTLEPAESAVTAAVRSELEGGQFTIETDEPHVKVAWRLTAQAVTREEER
jgi:hypothetical protein